MCHTGRSAGPIRLARAGTRVHSPSGGAEGNGGRRERRGQPARRHPLGPARRRRAALRFAAGRVLRRCFELRCGPPFRRDFEPHRPRRTTPTRSGGCSRTSRRSARRSRPSTSRWSRVRSRPRSPACTCGTAPTRSPATRRTGSSATAWCTASGSSAARPSGTGTATCTPRCTTPRPASATDRRAEPSNQSNVSAIWHGDRLLTSGEVGLPYELSPKDLSTTGVVRLRRPAHRPRSPRIPKIDPATGRLHFFGYGFVPPYPHVPRRRAGRSARLQHRGAGPRVHDDPRLHDHRHRRGVLGAPGPVRSRVGDEVDREPGFRGLSVPLGRPGTAPASG